LGKHSVVQAPGPSSFFFHILFIFPLISQPILSVPHMNIDETELKTQSRHPGRNVIASLVTDPQRRCEHGCLFFI